MEPRQIHPVDVPYVWHEVKPLVDKVLDRADGEMISSDYIEPSSLESVLYGLV